MKTILQCLALAVILCSAASCQKVISVKLNNSAPQYVIQGKVTDNAGPYTVTISRTKDFSGNNTFDSVSGASVVIMDSTSGVIDTLRATEAGVYQTQKITGVRGHTYHLTVAVAGQTFTASSAMPAVAVAIDTLYAGRSAIGSDIFMTPVFTDPIGAGNYYRILQTIHDTAVKGSFVRSDDATDGQTYTFQLYYDTGDDAGNPKIHNGDSISAELQCINRGVYDYYRTLRDVTGASNTATPANPLTNITGGALGVFNACTSRTRKGVARY